jgi:signal transduction histidine kinase
VRRRLTIFIVGLVALVLVLAGVGTWYLSEQSVRRSGQSEALSAAQTLAKNTNIHVFLPKLAALRPKVRTDIEKLVRRLALRVGHFDGVYYFTVPDGVETGSVPPASLQIPTSTFTSLVADSGSGPASVTGVSGSEAWAATTHTTTNATTGRATVTVVLVTRHIDGASWSGDYLILAAALLLSAALIAIFLSRRITVPLLRAVRTTERIAAGDLDARMGTSSRDYEELRSLAGAIDAMATNLGRLRNTERQFLLSVSHELRTPLTSIRGYAEAIADGAATDTTRAALVITNEARRLERLVADLLDLAKLDARSFSFHLRDVDAAEVVEEAAEELRPVIDQAGLRLRVASSGPLIVRADPDRLDQILANLLENAAKFATSEVSIGAFAFEGSVAIAVVDDGPGIPEGDLSRVFARHYTLDRHPHANRPVGSGLGLAIAAELTAAMGAVIWAESPVMATGGTRMVIRLVARPAG